MTTKRTMREPPANEELEALLEKVRKLPPMTPEEIAAQRKSWVIGELMLDDQELTREEAERRYDEVLKNMGYGV